MESGAFSDASTSVSQFPVSNEHSYEFLVFSDEDTHVKDYQGLEVSNSCCLVDEVEITTERNNKQPREHLSYKWVIFEKATCDYDEHFLQVESSKEHFETVEDCLWSFRMDTTYEKFDISREWRLYIQAVKSRQ